MSAGGVEVLTQAQARVRGQWALDQAPFGYCDDVQIMARCDAACRILGINCRWVRGGMPVLP